MKLFQHLAALVAATSALLTGLAASPAAAQSLTYTQVSSSNFASATTTAATASPGTLNATYGLRDISGNVWSLAAGSASSALVTNPWNNGVLARPAGETSNNEQIQIDASVYNNSSTIYALLRYSGSSGTSSGYMVGLNSANVAIYYLVNGTFTQIGANHTFAAQTAGATLTLTATAEQTNSTTTTIYYTVSNGATVIASGSATDTTAALQNTASAIPAVLMYEPKAGAQQPVVAIRTYAPASVAATAYTLTGPSSGNVGSASSFVASPNGTVGNSTVITLSDGGAGGTFTPSTITFAANSASGQSFTYTPSAAGTDTISATNNGGLTNPSSISFSATTAITIPVSSAAFHFSPANWRGDTGRGGTAWRQSWNNGAYFTVVWNASASPTATILIPATSNSNKVSYFLNGVLADNLAATGNIVLSGIAPSATNTLTVYLRNSTQSARWGQASAGGNTVQIDGLQIDGSSAPGTAPVPAKGWVLIVGDSITEGIATNYGSDDNLYDYSYLVGQSLLNAGYDYSVSACGYSGWIRPGDSTGDVPGYYAVSGGTYSEASSRWDKIDSGISLLDANNHISGWGSTGQEPAGILINYMTNEALSSLSTSDSQASVTGALAALRGSAPNAQIMTLMPFALRATSKYSALYPAALQNGVSSYLAATPSDKKTALIDLGIANTIQSSTYLYSDLTHPTIIGHAFVAPQVAGAVLNKLTPGGQPHYANGFH